MAGTHSGYAPRDVETLSLYDEIAEGNVVQFIRRIIYNPDGTVLLTTDTTLAGAPYTPVGAVGQSDKLALDNLIEINDNTEVEDVACHIFNVASGVPWTTAAIPGGTDLVGMTFTVITGTVTVVDADGTTVTLIPVGFNASWQCNNDNADLVPLTSITAADAGSRAIVTMRVRP